MSNSWKKFNIANCIEYIHASWQEMKPSTINACWRKIWPQVVKKDNAFPPLQDEEKEIVRIAHQIGGEGFDDMRADEIDELLNSHEKELSDEDLMLQKEEDSKECEEVESEDESRGGEKSKSGKF